MTEYIWIAYIAVNTAGLLIMAYDKLQAKKKGSRVPERTLMMLAFLGGAFGMLLAMYTLRHKTRKPLFVYGVPMMCLMHVTLIVVNVFNLI